MVDPSQTDTPITLGPELVEKYKLAGESKPNTTTVDDEGFIVEPADQPGAEKETPVEKAAPAEKEPAKEAAAAPVAAEPDVMASIDALIAKVDEDLTERRAARPKPEARTPEIPADIKAGLEHEDEAIRGLTRRVIDAEATVQQQRLESMTEKKNAEITQAQKDYGLTPEETAKVVQRLVSSPALAAELSFEEGVHLVLPGRTRGTNGGDPKPGGNGRPVVRVPSQPADAAKLVEPGAAAGPVPRAPEKRPENESMEAAIARGARRLGLLRE